jgi:hypothetical protein
MIDGSLDTGAHDGELLLGPPWLQELGLWT